MPSSSRRRPIASPGQVSDTARRPAGRRLLLTHANPVDEAIRRAENVSNRGLLRYVPASDVVTEDRIQVFVWTAYLRIGNGGDRMSTVIDALDVELGQRIEIIVTDGAIDIVATPSRPLTGLSVEHVPVLINVMKRAAQYAEADKHARETAWSGYES